MKHWLKKPLRRLTALTSGVALALAGMIAVASPASAADSGTLSFSDCGVNQASVDNSPGNGATSWAWLWRQTWVSNETILRIDFYNGSHTFLELWDGATVTSSSYWNDDIWRVQIQCYIGSGQPGAGLGPWVYFDRG